MIAISKGVTLIEASAGTGKTYTLCQIILRLIISENIPIDRILAITFTQAATEELNSRIRNLLRDSLEQIESQNITDKSLQNILEQSSIKASVAGQRLNNSLQLFDEATIATIHGFCKRCLETLSLESGVPFDAALEPIDDELISQLKDEFIRIHILERSYLLTLAYHSTPRYSKKFKTVAKESASHPYARIRPEPQTVDYGLFDTAFGDIQNGVESLLDRAVELIPSLKANSRFAKRLSEPSESSQLASLTHRKHPLVEDLKLLEDLSLSSWLKAVKKAHKDLDPPEVCKAIDPFLAQIENAIDGLVWEYREWLFRLLSQEKERRNILSFNDLIHLLHKTLRSDADASSPNSSVINMMPLSLMNSKIPIPYSTRSFNIYSEMDRNSYSTLVIPSRRSTDSAGQTFSPISRLPNIAANGLLNYQRTIVLRQISSPRSTPSFHHRSMVSASIVSVFTLLIRPRHLIQIGGFNSGQSSSIDLSRRHERT